MDICRTLVKAFLDRTKPIATQYGAVVGLGALGPAVVRVLLVPHVEPYVTEVLQPAMEDASNSTRQQEAWKCHGTLVKAVAQSMYDKVTSQEVDRIAVQALAAGRGTKPPAVAEAARRPAAGDTEMPDADRPPAATSGAAAAAAPGRARAAAEGGRSVREVLADSWRDDSDADEVMWALSELFGERFLAQMHSPGPVTHLL